MNTVCWVPVIYRGVHIQHPETVEAGGSGLVSVRNTIHDETKICQYIGTTEEPEKKEEQEQNWHLNSMYHRHIEEILPTAG